MTRPYKLHVSKVIAPAHPLHWCNFWPDLQRVHKANADARQDLVLWLANIYVGALKSGRPRGFCEVQIRLMDLRAMVRDYKPALNFFFEVKKLGFFVDEENMEVSTVIPRELPLDIFDKVEDTTKELKYLPPDIPPNDVVSKVYLQSGINEADVIAKVMASRPELVPAVQWIFSKQCKEFNFHFRPSGKLKLRDTSTWPIQAIETWPSWLREELFGPGIDLDSAYIQFLLHYLKESFKDEPQQLELLFPDILRLLNDKENFRREVCALVFKKPYTEVYRSKVKNLLMSIANGSKISPSILTSGTGFSLTAEIIIDDQPDACSSDLIEIGNRLKRIADQFTMAKKYVCMELERRKVNRQNLKKVFSKYFEWERHARYAIWEACDRHGIMVHDGLDGVPAQYLKNLDSIITALDLKLTT